MAQDNVEFKIALRELSLHAPKLKNPYGNQRHFAIISFTLYRFLDRVRCSEWLRKLSSLKDDNLETAKIRNEYIQYLKIQVRNRFLHGPFTKPPPEDPYICPLPELLANNLAEQVLI